MSYSIIIVAAGIMLITSRRCLVFGTGEMRNSRPKAAFLIQLLFALFFLICPGTPTDNTTKTNILRTLKVGYLTAARGGWAALGNRQGLAISGALTYALKQVSDIQLYKYG